MQKLATPQNHMNRAIHPPKALLRVVGRAIADFNMIRPNDRVLLGLSGGKDSLSLLHILLHLQRRAPIQFELGAITVDSQSGTFDPSALKPYMEELEVHYIYHQQPIVGQAKQNMKNDSYIAYCSRIKRGIMYHVAREQGYNVLALAQHLDDLAESFLMSAFHCGQLRTMKANYTNQAGDVRIIRPLVYARERQTADFAKNAQLPVIPDSSPDCFDMPTQRQYMKTLLANGEQQNPYLFKSLLRAMNPLIRKNTAD